MTKLVTAIGFALAISTSAFAQSAGTASLAGTVVDSTQHPIVAAEVSLPALSITGLTDANGNFRFTGITAGSQRVVIRKIGFGQLDTSIVFADSQSIVRRVTLGRIVRLDSVVVKAASPLDPLMAEFETNRAKGFGRFVTREQIEKTAGATLSSVVATLQGLSLLRGQAGQSWVMSKRSPATRCPPVRPGMTYAEAVQQQRVTDDCLRSERIYYVPEDFEAGQGMKRGCYSLVYLDRSAMNLGHPTLPFDVNQFIPSQIEAIEWYETDAQIPPPYTAADARCGLLVLHKRRGAP